MYSETRARPPQAAATSERGVAPPARKAGMALHRWFRAAVGLAISAVMLAVIAARTDFHVLAGAWASVTFAMLAAAGLISVMEVSVRAVRWRILLEPFTGVSFVTSLGYLTIGQLANTVLPARLGDVTRAVLAGTRLRVSRMSVLGTIAVERVADAGLLGLALALGATLGLAGMLATLITLSVVVVTAASVIVTAALVLRGRWMSATRIGHLLNVHGGRFLAGGRALRSPGALASVLFLTVLSFSLAIAIFSTVAAATGLSVPVWQAALVIAAVTLSTAIPAGPASIGPYELVGMTLMTGLGYPAETSLLCVALVHIVALMPASAMGLAATWWLGLGLRGVQVDEAVLESGG
jgi:glycosyltransferase 2 family protein